MKKKFLSLAMAIFVLISCIPICGSVSAADSSGTCGENLTWTFDGNKLTISGNGLMDNYQSSKEVPWNASSYSIRFVTVESGVKSIGKYAFGGCSNLSQVTLPNSLLTIEDSAFWQCGKLTSIKIPEGVTSLGSRSFYGAGLTQFTMPASINSIGEDAFLCRDLERVYISDIESYLNIDFKNDASNPMKYANTLYIGGKHVTSINIPNGITNIPAYAFSCDHFNSIVIPDTVKSIDNYAFKDCSSLTGIKIPDSVTTIGKYAFEGCSTLTDITFGNGLISIDLSAFNKCENLDKVYISDITSYLNINFKNTYSTPMFYADKLYLNNKRITSLDIPEGVTKIADYALSCDSIKSVKLPDSLQSIGYRAFKGNAQLKSISIPNSVTSIGSSAFSGCNSITEMTLPFIGTSPNGNNTANSVLGTLFGYSETEQEGTTEQIYADGSSAFYYIPSTLQKVTLTNAEQIPYGAFSNCTGLIEITIPENTASIGDNSFKNCSALTTINYNSANCTNGANAFNSCPSLTTVNFGETVKVIPENMFNGCTGLTALKFDNVTTVGKGAFAGCTSIETASLGNNLESIYSNAFDGCTSLTNITVPNTVMEIEQAAFRNCSNLTTVKYNGDENEWDEIFIASENECLTNSDIKYNSSEETPSPSPSASPSPSPSPTPSVTPSPSPAPALTVTKSETEDTYDFELTTDKAYENYDAYAAVYDINGVLLSINKIPLAVTGNTYISVNKSEKDAFAKIFVFSKELQPLTESAKEFNLTK